MHILILDTDDGFLESLSSILRESGHSVEITQDLEKAISHCSPGGSDLVLLDPSSNPEMLSRVREYNSEIPVVVMSRNPSIESVIAALRLGAFDFFIKPIEDREQLIEAIERVRRSIEAASYQRTYLNRILKTFSELSFANENVRDQGYTNGTTEHYYNQYFEDILSIELARSQRFDHSFTIMSVRLNYLLDYESPETNIEFRSQAETISGILHQRMRRTDVVARTGINEFMIILVETPKENARIVVDSLYQEIATIVPTDINRSGEAEANLPFVIGTAAYPIDGMECQVLLKKAHQNSL